MTKDEKSFKKFKSKFSFIFEDQYLSPLMKNHFDNNGTFICFVVGLMQNQLDSKQVINQLNINKDEWAELFCNLYKNQQIIDLYKQLEINPIISFEKIVESFNCFDDFIHQLINFINHHEINLGISNDRLFEMIKSVYGYLLYNKIDNRIDYDFKDILLDNDYDTKFLFILNNTKLFAIAKKQIIDNCKQKINNLIVLLLGMNKSLNKDK